MINEIIELLPSPGLKAKIKETRRQFKENELLQIIVRYAGGFNARNDMLESFAQTASPDIAALAREYIRYGKEKFKRFTESEDGFVYELSIKESPVSHEEKYLCSSYNAALVCIDRFYEEYACVNAKENEETRYRIVKRKIFSEADVFDEDAYAECVLGEGKTVLSVTDYRDGADCELDINCTECTRICPRRCDELIFPCFARKYDIIKYRDYDGKECFGVNLCCLGSCGSAVSEYYVIPLDSSVVREHCFEDALYAHEHIELPLAFLAEPCDLDETAKRNYFALVEYLKENKL